MADPRYDVEGYDVITSALIGLLNEFPGLPTGGKIKFGSLEADGGITMFPTSGAVIEQEKNYIYGGVYQLCRYPFTVYYRVAGQSENRKVAVQEWLDLLGRWLEGQVITIGATNYQLASYPAITGGRRFKDIRRQSPAYLESIDENHIEDWVVSITARYENEF